MVWSWDEWTSNDGNEASKISDRGDFKLDSWRRKGPLLGCSGEDGDYYITESINSVIIQETWFFSLNWESNPIPLSLSLSLIPNKRANNYTIQIRVQGELNQSNAYDLISSHAVAVVHSGQ